MRASVLLVLVLLLAGCGVDDAVNGTTDDPPDQYADYLVSRAAARRLVPDLAAALAAGLGGYVDTISGRPDGCRTRSEETTGYEYAVTATIVSPRTDPGFATVARVLTARGWVVTEEARVYRDRQRIAASRPGLSVGINEGDPPSRLVLRSGAACFLVPAGDREGLLDLEEELARPPGSRR